MRLHPCVAIFATCLSSFACVSSSGNSDTTTPPTHVQVVITGNLVELDLPFFSASSGAQFSNNGYIIDAYDSQTIMRGNPASAQTMGHASPNPGATCILSGCPYAMALNANNTTLPFGVITVLNDSSGNYSNIAYTTGLSNAALAAEEPNHPITNLVTFAVPAKTITTAATAVSSSAGAVTNQGMLIGIVVGSIDNIQKNSLPPPAKGASVSLKSTNVEVVLYSPSDYSGTAPSGDSATTNEDGIFFALGPSVAGGAAQEVQFSVSQAGLSWSTQTTAVVPGYITVAVFYAS